VFDEKGERFHVSVCVFQRWTCTFECVFRWTDVNRTCAYVCAKECPTISLDKHVPSCVIYIASERRCELGWVGVYICERGGGGRAGGGIGMMQRQQAKAQGL